MANQILPEFQVDRLKKLRDQHTYWREPLLSRQCDPTTPADLLLSIQFLLSDLLLSTCDAAEEETAHFDSHFERTLDLMAVYLARWPECIMLDPPTLRHVGREAQTSFSLDPEVLPALNMMCYKCRNQDLRRRIIQLMYKMKRREGINYSVALADGCRWLANIEEKRAEDIGLDAKTIPEQARFWEAIIGHEIACLKLHTYAIIDILNNLPVNPAVGHFQINLVFNVPNMIRLSKHGNSTSTREVQPATDFRYCFRAHIEKK
ncbi:Hypothetical protein D9617_18g032730 [Elsinoe fawcettii]|nr:Hypothetical protein D9617_18g032730 [Elsinoe fawcettii]